VSYFDALRASDATLEADFAFLRRHGLDGVRILPNWWQCAAERQCGGHPGPDTLFEAERRHPIARPPAAGARSPAATADRRLSFARETVRKRGGAGAVAGRRMPGRSGVVLRARRWHPHVMIDLQNEIDQNRLFAAGAAEDARQLALLAGDRAAATHRLRIDQRSRG
jgi:hypothetical protein